MKRILSEQRECRDCILENKGSDTAAGAWLGLGDWVAEEMILRAAARESAAK